MSGVTRRKFLRSTAAGIGAAGLTSTAPWVDRAWGAETLIGVQWGGPWIEGAKAVAERQDKYEIRWELHTGGSAAIIPKIKSAWPNPLYDFVAQFTPLYYTWRDEGWPEPVTFDEMPNLREVPEEDLLRNDKGEILNIPLSHSAVFFGYRKDIVPFEVKVMEDLLDPRLKGQVIVRDATQGINNNTVNFALAFGGDERNLEPGWDFLKKLAKSGNIARIGKSEVEFINALTSGEASVGFWNLGGWGAVSENFPCEFLIRDEREAPGFQAGLFTEGYLIPKNSPRKEAVKDFLNFHINAENSAIYNRHVNMGPANVNAEATGLAKLVQFKDPEKRRRFTHSYDYEYLAPRKDAMIKRFEQEIVPLLS